MFDITNSRGFYEKLLNEFDDFMSNPVSSRHAMNFAITAHHMADWVWVDFIGDDDVLRGKLGIGTKLGDFHEWIDSRSDWFGVVQKISNGSKHFIRRESGKSQAVGGWGIARWGQDNFGDTYLVFDTGKDNPAAKFTRVTRLAEEIVSYWRDFMKAHSPYELLPVPRTRLSDG